MNLFITRLKNVFDAERFLINYIVRRNAFT